MSLPEVASRDQWLAERAALLAKEKELTRARDALAAERRRMPRMAVEKQYGFEGPNGPASLLDLNLPRKDGREVLAEIKADDDLRTIPVVILTTSQAEEDVLRSYELHANAYVTKPVDFERFIDVVRQIDDFFVTVVKLPGQ